MAEEKPVAATAKKVAAEKKVAKEQIPIFKQKVASAKNLSDANVTSVKKRSLAEEQTGEKPVAETKKTSNEKVTEPMIAPVKEEKFALSEIPAIEVAKEKPIEKKEEPKLIKPPSKEWAGNPMLMPIIEKVTVNMSVGQSGRPLEQAETILKKLTNQKPSKRKAKKTVREFGIRKGESIACLVTLRGGKAEEFLRKALYASENKLSKYCFDRQGNFAFGIKEHINIPGTRYSPELGIHGMDVAVSLGRAGYRVKRRHRKKSKIGKDHLLTAKEAILFIKDEFDVEIA